MANENAEDLKIKIPLTPSQNTSFPALIEKLNSDSEMQMSPIALSNGFLEISCHDLSDLLEQLKSSTPLECRGQFPKGAFWPVSRSYGPGMSANV